MSNNYHNHFKLPRITFTAGKLVLIPQMHVMVTKFKNVFFITSNMKTNAFKSSNIEYALKLENLINSETEHLQCTLTFLYFYHVSTTNEDFGNSRG